MKGIVKEDLVNTILEGYSVNGIIIQNEEIAKNNVGEEVEYEIINDGYREFGAFSAKFYEKAIIKNC